MLLDTHKDEIEALIARYASARSAVLPLLYIAQDRYGHLDDAAVREVAQILGLPPTDVFEVVGFYSLFYSRPMGQWVLQVCDDVPCCYSGAEELIDALKQSLGIQEEQTTPDRMFTLQRVKCVAACNRAPVLQANLDYIYDVSPERVDALLSDLRARAGEAKQRGLSGRQSEDFQFGPDGRLAQIERFGSYADRWAAERAAALAADERTKAAAAEQASADEAAAKADADARTKTEAPTVPSPDQTNAGVMPRAADGAAVPANVEGTGSGQARHGEPPANTNSPDGKGATPARATDSEQAPPSATGQPQPLLDRPADQTDVEKKPVEPRRSPFG
jgi:NADH-quinone oxidoreductase subunit E